MVSFGNVTAHLDIYFERFLSKIVPFYKLFTSFPPHVHLLVFCLSVCLLKLFSSSVNPRSESESESEEEEKEEELPLLSEEEMNKLGAKLVKAEIMGNTVRSHCHVLLDSGDELSGTLSWRE